MAVRCPQCGTEYDVALFEFEKTVRCGCGETVLLQHKEVFDKVLRDRKDENARTRQVKDLADRISVLIISTDYPDIDIEAEKQKLKEMIGRLFPDKTHMYDLVYEPRFKRLSEQFRENKE